MKDHLHAVRDIHGGEVYERGRLWQLGAGPGIVHAVLLALATCSELPAHEMDDRFLHAALAARGAPFERPVWDDPAVDWARFDSVLIRTTWDYQDKLAAFRRWAERAAAVTRLWNPLAVVRWNTHKHYLRELERAGVPVVPTIWLDRGSEVSLRELVPDLGAAEGFLKPCVGATARETMRFLLDDAGLERAQAHVDRLLPNEDLMLQPFLHSVTERGEWSAIFVGGRITHCVRKIPVPGDYRVQDDFGARDEIWAPTDGERGLAENAMTVAERLLGVDLLYGRVDCLWREDGSSALTELELVEPSLFFRHCPAAATALALAWLAR